MKRKKISNKKTHTYLEIRQRTSKYDCMPESLYNAGVSIEDFQRCVDGNGIFKPDKKFIKKYSKLIHKGNQPNTLKKNRKNTS